MPKRARIRRLTRALRLLTAIAYLVAGLFTWQLALVELAETHDSARIACTDDGDGDDHERDCGFNCHCCFQCAHHGPTAVSDLAPLAAPLRLLDFVELPSFERTDAFASIDRSPPLKVPKTST